MASSQLRNPVHSLDNVKPNNEYVEHTTPFGEAAWVWFKGERMPWHVFVRRGRKMLRESKAAIEAARETKR
jgi:hypothetical protein